MFPAKSNERRFLSSPELLRANLRIEVNVFRFLNWGENGCNGCKSIGPIYNFLRLQEVLTALYPTVAATSSSSSTGPSFSSSSSTSSRTPTPPHTSPSRNQHLCKQRVSAYDNLLSGSAGDLDEEDREDGGDDVSSDDGTVTEFSEPWDSARWDRLLSSSSPASSLRTGSSNSGRRKRPSLLPRESSTLNTAASSSDGGIGTLSDFETLRTNKSPVVDHRRNSSSPPSAMAIVTARPPPVPTLLRTRSFKDKMDPLLAAPRLLALRSACNSQPGKNLQVRLFALHFHFNLVA